MEEHSPDSPWGPPAGCRPLPATPDGSQPQRPPPRRAPRPTARLSEGVVAHDAALPHPLPADLELGLHHHEPLRLEARSPREGRGNSSVAEMNETSSVTSVDPAHVGNSRLDGEMRVRWSVRGRAPSGPLEGEAVELPVADVDSHDGAARPPLEQAVHEATRSTRRGRDTTRREGSMARDRRARPRQLLAAARHEAPRSSPRTPNAGTPAPRAWPALETGVSSTRMRPARMNACACAARVSASAFPERPVRRGARVRALTPRAQPSRAAFASSRAARAMPVGVELVFGADACPGSPCSIEPVSGGPGTRTGTWSRRPPRASSSTTAAEASHAPACLLDGHERTRPRRASATMRSAIERLRETRVHAPPRRETVGGELVRGLERGVHEGAVERSRA